MSIRRLLQLGVPQAFSASGQFSVELAPVQGTITELLIYVRADITTTAAPTNFNDYWDRIFATMSLQGGGGNFFQFSNLRLPYHFTRHLKRRTTRRPTVIAASQTNALMEFAYLWHFGVMPWREGEVDQFDLTAGIPPVTRGNLTLSGTFGGATAPGTNVTVNTGTTFDVYAHVVQPESANEDPRRWMPRAYPNWTMRTPTPTATSAPFGTQDDVPGGDYLRSIELMLTAGTNAPRAGSVLSSLEIYDQRASRSIWRVGGQVDLAPPGRSAELIGQTESLGIPPSDDASTLGVPSVAYDHDAGLIPIELYKYTERGHPLYGLDLRSVGTGGVQLRYGVRTVTNVTMDALYEKYRINTEHPDNRALVGA